MLDKQRKKFKRSLERLPRKIDSLKNRFRVLFRATPKPVVAFHIDGGLGDHICGVRLVRDMVAYLGDLEYDVYCKLPPVADWLLQDAPGCRLVADRKADFRYLRFSYAAVFRAYTFLLLERPLFHRERDHELERKLSALSRTIERANQPLHAVIDAYPRLDGYLGHYASVKGLRRHQFLHHTAQIPYGGDRLPLRTDDRTLIKLGLMDREFVTISNGFDREMNGPQHASATKVYPHLQEVIVQLKKRRPSLQVVQIGSSTSTPLPGVDIDLINKTSLQEVAAILEHSRLHIDGEGGLVHMASALGTKSCVIFGPTLASYFGYEHNINLAPGECGGCWWMESTWMFQCIRGDVVPRCMVSHAPESIAQRIVDELTAQSLSRTTHGKSV